MKVPKVRHFTKTTRHSVEPKDKMSETFFPPVLVMEYQLGKSSTPELHPLPDDCKLQLFTVGRYEELNWG